MTFYDIAESFKFLNMPGRQISDFLYQLALSHEVSNTIYNISLELFIKGKSKLYQLCPVTRYRRLTKREIPREPSTARIRLIIIKVMQLISTMNQSIQGWRHISIVGVILCPHTNSLLAICRRISGNKFRRAIVTELN